MKTQIKNGVVFSTSAVNLMMQMANAEEMELRMIAKLQDMEKRGIVRHYFQDSWTILDQKRYNEEMGNASH